MTVLCVMHCVIPCVVPTSIVPAVVLLSKCELKMNNSCVSTIVTRAFNFGAAFKFNVSLLTV